MNYTQQVVSKLKKKYPIIYDRFAKGEAGLAELNWIIDNIDKFREAKLPYTILKETNIKEVLPDGTHIYHEPAIIADNAIWDDTEKIPATLNDIVADVLPKFAGMETTSEFKMGEDKFASFCHSQLSGGIGMHIRNDYHLWDFESAAHLHFKTIYKLEHPDDMSDLIIRHVYRRMS